jgi:hypothetical protein
MGNVNPYVFVVGCPRSGTTLLQRLLDAHPELAVINETLWITREAKNRTGVAGNGLVTPELVSRLFELRRFQRLELPRADVERLVEERLSYARFVTRVFDLYGQVRGKRLVGDKSPGYVRELRKLHALWPSARFVHLIRDGRDVWLSVAAWKKADRTVGHFATWAVDAVVTTALWWERSVRLGREAGASLGPALYHEVRYEDLVADPARACGVLCGFLGLPYDAAMLRFHEGRAKKHEPGLPSKRAWLPPTSGLRDSRSQMPVEDHERFEAVAGDLLDELGYPRMISRVSAATAAEAARIRSAFTEDARARKRVLPERWQS